MYRGFRLWVRVGVEGGEKLKERNKGRKEEREEKKSVNEGETCRYEERNKQTMKNRNKESAKKYKRVQNSINFHDPCKIKT